jgi:pilus assembly protein CpaF
MPALLHPDKTRSPLDALKPGEFFAIGSAANADVRLTADGVAPRHARIANDNGLFTLAPLSSKFPVFLNDQYVGESGHPLADADKIQIGEWSLLFDDPPADGAGDSSSSRDPFAKKRKDDADLSDYERLKRKIHSALIERMNLRGMESSSPDELRLRTDRFILSLLEEKQADIQKAGIHSETLRRDLLQLALGYGILDDLLADPLVSEIMCLGDGRIYVEKKGKITLANRKFDDPAELRAIIERIVGPIGRRIDESSPIVDGRLADGSRINAVVEPIALDGPTLDIRKFTANQLGIDDLVRGDSLTPQMAAFLELAVQQRQNVIVAGGTGSGKTTLLNILSSFIPSDERIVTIEDSAELRLRQDHVVRLESRPQNIEGKGEIPIRVLVKNALRMRPDRIVVGECRGGEALDMLQAMNTGHDGSLTTLHANSPRDVVSRLETMAMMSGLDLPQRAIRKQIASAVNVVCHQSRLPDGSRRIVSIAEVVPTPDGEDLSLRDIYLFRRTGIDRSSGRILGRYEYTGAVPAFIETLRAAGIPFDESIFSMPTPP